MFKLNNKTRNILGKLLAKVTETERTFAGNPADIATLFNNCLTSIFTIDPNIKDYTPDVCPDQSNNNTIEEKLMFSPYYTILTLTKLKVQMEFQHDC